MSVVLRDYQEALVNDIRAAMRSDRRVLAVAPTGAGKTVIFSHIAHGVQLRGRRAVIVAHRREIVDQIGNALAGFSVRYGRVQPGHSLTGDAVQIAMVQTLANRIHRLPEPDLLVVDEAHHAVAGSWSRLAEAWPNVKILGVTATPERLDGRGLGTAFDTLVEGPTTGDLIERGFLADFDYFAPPAAADLSNVGTRAGDYAIDQLAAAMDKASVTGDAIEHYRQHLAGRPALAFCVTVAHAEHVAKQFRDAGFRAASVDGKLDPAERARRVAAIGNGGLQILTSCELISEGFDVPSVAGAILLRRTQSLALFLQQIGRVLRIKSDGSRAVILDHVGNVNLHGSPKTPRIWSLDSKKRKAREASVRQCKVCFGVWGAGEKSECANRALPDCLFTSVAKPAEPVALPEYVPGVLEQVAERPRWAGGIDILRASGPEWRALVNRARTKEQLAEIARMRGYKPTWPYVILQQRKQRNAGRAA
jgi:superfamily II DNA or RNA helicase